MKKLEGNQIDQALQNAPGWVVAGGKLQREWSFGDFIEAMKFVNRVAEIAEAAGHHPDIDIRYNKVTLGLITHDVDGITVKDAKMAARLGREL